MLKSIRKEFKDVDPDIIDIIRGEVLNEATKGQIAQTLIMRGYDLPNEKIYNAIYNKFKMSVLEASSIEHKVYILTAKENNKIEAMFSLGLAFEDLSNSLSDNLNIMDSNNIYTTDRLKSKNIDKNKYGYSNMYDLVKSYVAKVKALKLLNK